MAVTLNFRSSLSGFNKEDVVRYIEYMTTKNASQVNQLLNENEELRNQLAQTAAIPDLSEEVAQLTAQLEEMTAKLSAAIAENDQLKVEYQTLLAGQAEAAAKKLAAQELEAYRRAEQAERDAKVRADQIYQQAIGTLAQATAQVDGVANNFQEVANAISNQMSLLQQVVDNGKNALLDAATTLYTISPEHKE